MLYNQDEVKRFIVFFQGRAGSTYLIDLLNSHSQIAAQVEQFDKSKKEMRRHKAQTEWTKAFFEVNSPIPYRAIGFKTKLSDIVERLKFADVLRSLSVNVIYLRRHNVVKQTISWINAERLFQTTGAWELYEEDKGATPLKVNLADFASRLNGLIQGQNRLTTYVEQLHLPILCLTYENLLNNCENELKKVFQFLNTPYEQVHSNIKKNTNDNLRLAVSNFEELKAMYANTEYEAMFDEEYGYH